MKLTTLRVLVAILAIVPLLGVVGWGIDRESLGLGFLLSIPFLSSLLLACFCNRRISRGVLFFYWVANALQCVVVSVLINHFVFGATDLEIVGGMIAYCAWMLSGIASGLYLAHVSQQPFRQSDKDQMAQEALAMAAFSGSSDGLQFMKRAQRAVRMQALATAGLSFFLYNFTRLILHFKQTPVSEAVVIANCLVIAVFGGGYLLAGQFNKKWQTMALLLESGLTLEEAREKAQLRGETLVAALNDGKLALYRRNPVPADEWREKVKTLLRDKYKITASAANAELADDAAAAFDAFLSTKPEKKAQQICLRLAKTHRKDPGVFVQQPKAAQL